MAFTVAIIGRPNVGKSTLFNRLVGKRLALVDDQPGVTRDLREGEARLGGLVFTVVDTAGLEDVTDESLQGRMRKLTERAIDMADLCLFMVDARAGITATDRVLADMLRKRSVTVVLVANKAEGRVGATGMLEAFELGLGEPLAFSAEHGEGMGDLFAALAPHVDAAKAAAADLNSDALDDDDPARPMQIAIMGRPNAGKSTLVNAIIGQDRLLTGPEAGITRDSIAVDTNWGGRAVRIHDTAGLRRKAKVQEKLEKMSTGDGIRAIKFAEVVILLLDVDQAFEQQDLRLADLAEREGRAVVIAVNKWDLEPNKTARRKALREQLDRLLPQLRGVEMVTLSALTGEGLQRLGAAVERAHAVWNKRIPTAALNRWILGELEAHPPPAVSGRRIRMRYMTQVRTRPPGFVVMCSRPDDVPDSYSRFLVNGLRRDFDLTGTPIRMMLRKGKNPYDGG